MIFSLFRELSHNEWSSKKRGTTIHELKAAHTGKFYTLFPPSLTTITMLTADTSLSESKKRKTGIHQINETLFHMAFKETWKKYRKR